MSMMLSPVPLKTFNTSSGNVYTADQYGVIQNVATQQDQTDLLSAGCVMLNPPSQQLLGFLHAANFNITTDQLIPFYFNGKYRVRRISVLNTTVPGMSTAAGGFYTATGKGGSAIVAATQTYTGLTNAATVEDMTIALPNLANPAGTPFYLSLTTAQGAAAAADVYVFGDVYP